MPAVGACTASGRHRRTVALVHLLDRPLHAQASDVTSAVEAGGSLIEIVL